MISEKAKKLGEALVSAKVLTPDQLQEAMTAAEKKKTPSLIIGLLEAGHLSYQIFEKFVSSTLGIKTAIISDMLIDKRLLSQIGEKYIREKRIFPIALKGSGGVKTLALGMVDPIDSETIDSLQQNLGARVIPVLISLPDFEAAVQNKFAGGSVELKTADDHDEKIVLIRPGGYEEEIAFQSKMAEKTRTAQKERLPRIGEKKDGEGSDVFALGANPTKSKPRFLGPGGKKFKEEILAKLELMGSDAKALKKETYTKELLFNELPEVSTNPLEKVYEKMGSRSKLEGLINALIKNGALTKRDLMVSAAISYIFSEELGEEKQ